MATEDEIGQLISEVESLRDMMLEEISKIKNNMEILREDFEDLKKEMKKK